MSTVTAADIRTYVIDAALDAEFDSETLDKVEGAVLEAAPLSTWELVNLNYESSALSTDEFWAIVEKVTA
ncbi:hypothetical protein [Dermacoccus sp. Tok2021]|uniref:hypothetical protein n=1 Tax=Dermacoccus sp. Tok2021 TaxID=2826873 RepID=UPI001CA684DF|nr:hypothetical protein [Dermacoccus sp. Tok2021]MBZ4497953.1 hypothetical protein [Dermacoccus sp. Tok2021]